MEQKRHNNLPAAQVLDSMNHERPQTLRFYIFQEIDFQYKIISHWAPDDRGMQPPDLAHLRRPSFCHLRQTLEPIFFCVVIDHNRYMANHNLSLYAIRTCIPPVTLRFVLYHTYPGRDRAIDRDHVALRITCLLKYSNQDLQHCANLWHSEYHHHKSDLIYLL